MEKVAVEFGVRQFRFSDEFFTVKRSHVEGVCGRIRKSKVLRNGAGVAWRASVGVNPHSVELFRLLRGAGCREISFGVESADDAVLEKVCRKGHFSDAEEAIANAHAADLKAKALIMVGLPGSTEETIRKDLRFVEEGEFDSVAVTVFTPLPGCEIERNPEAFGCEIIPERAKRSLCMYGPGGERNPIQPTIRIEGMDDAAWAAGMECIVDAAERRGKIGRGKNA